MPARRKGQLAENRMEKVVVGIRARRSCLITSQRLLWYASAHPTGDPAGVYPRLSKSQTFIVLPPGAIALAPPPFVPHTSVWRLRGKDNVADLGWGVAFSSGNAGTLHSVLPHPLSATLPTLSLAVLDRQTIDLSSSAPVGSWKLHGTYSRILSLPFTPCMSGRAGRCAHTEKQDVGDLEHELCCPVLLPGWSWPRLSSSLSLSFLIYPVNINRACGLDWCEIK